MTFDPRTEYQDLDTANAYDRKFESLSGQVFHWAESRQLSRIAREIVKGSRVLDAPCGTGRLTEIFLRQGLVAIGGDISGEMIHIARSRLLSDKNGASFSRMDFL